MKSLKVVFLLLFCGALALSRAGAEDERAVPEEVRAKVEEIRKDGYPVTWKELAKLYPEPPEGQNAAVLYQQAFDKFAADDASEGVPIVGLAPLPAPDEPLCWEMYANITCYLELNQESLKSLHEAGRLSGCRFPVDFTRGAKMLLPHLSKLRQGARLLALETMIRAEEMDSPATIESILDALALARAAGREPILISHLVAIACTSITLNSLERSMARTMLADPQLLLLDDALKSAESPRGLVSCMSGETCMGLDILSKPDELAAMTGADPTAMTLRTMLSGGFGREIDRYADLMHRMLMAAELPFNERIEAFRLVDADIRALPKHSLSRLIVPSLSRAAEYDVAHAARLRCARTAVAIQRYRLKEGRLPDKLSQLVPTFLPEVLADPFDGEELRYKRFDKCCIVYSIGPDQDDDGGLEAGRRRDDSDIVFLLLD